MLDTSYLVISLIFSSIGVGYSIYGKRQKHTVAFYSGLGLIMYPYLITGPLLLIVIGVALMAAPKFIRL